MEAKAHEATICRERGQESSVAIVCDVLLYPLPPSHGSLKLVGYSGAFFNGKYIWQIGLAFDFVIRLAASSSRASDLFCAQP